MKKYLLLAALLSPSLASANLIINGSFEDTIQANGTWDIYAAVNGWTTTNGIEIRNNVEGTASDGSNFAELDTNGNSSIQQTIDTVLGESYQLSFDYSSRIGTSSDTNNLVVSINGVSFGPISGEGGPVNDWKNFILPFTGFGPTVVNFACTGKSDGLGCNVDKIVAVQAVPAPAAVWLFGSALGLFGMSRRKSI
jgi:hypothetical protein